MYNDRSAEFEEDAGRRSSDARRMSVRLSVASLSDAFAGEENVLDLCEVISRMQ